MIQDRRGFIGGALALSAAACVPVDQSPIGRVASTLRLIEANAGGTLGAEIFDTGTGLSIGHNRDQRFGHCSSFKLSLAAMVLHRHPQRDDFRRMVRLSEEDVIGHSPFVREHVGEEVNLLDLAEATQRFSDNGAANVLLRETGGPEALTAFWRSIGDEVSRLDRTEPQLNNVPPGEVRDTSTPRAMARTVAKLVYGEVLESEDRALLRHWLIDTRTGMNRVRAGLPQNWQSGDKTGTSTWPNMGSLYIDVGFVEPATGAPITFAAYYRTREQTEGIDPAAEGVLAQVGRVLCDFARVRA